MELLRRIAGLQLQKVAERMEEQHGIHVEFSERAVAHVVAQCGAHETGARRLGQFIEHNVLTQLAQVWLRSMQEHITVRHVVLQAEGETSTLTPDAWVPQPRSGLQVQIHVHH